MIYIGIICHDKDSEIWMNHRNRYNHGIFDIYWYILFFKDAVSNHQPVSILDCEMKNTRDGSVSNQHTRGKTDMGNFMVYHGVYIYIIIFTYIYT